MKKQFSKQERRQQLLDSAFKIFGDRGYHQTQISHIIAEAKVARGTFYLYFESKQEIFAEVIADIFKKIRHIVRGIPKEAISDIPGALLANLKRVIDLLIQYPGITKVLFNESVGLDDDLDKKLKNFYQQTLKLIQKGLLQGHEMEFVRKGDYLFLSIFLLGGLKEFFYQHLLKTTPLSSKKLLHQLYSFIVHSIIAPDLSPEIKKLLELNMEIHHE